MTKKLLTIVVPTFNQADAVRELLLDLKPQVDAVADGSVLVRIHDDRSRDDIAAKTADLCDADIQFHRNPFRNGTSQQLQAAYAYTDSEYVWVINPTDRIAGNAVETVLAHLKRAAPDVLLLNRMHFIGDDIQSANVFSLPLHLVRDYANIANACMIAGFYGTTRLTSGVICRAGCPVNAWPLMPTAAPHVYMLLTRFRNSPVRVLGAPLVEYHSGHPSTPNLNDAAVSSQFLHLICTALNDNLRKGCDWRDLIHRTVERVTLPSAHNLLTYDAIQQTLDSFWRVRAPLRGDTLLAFYQLSVALGHYDACLLNLNRSAELCPGCNDLYHGNVTRADSWVTEVVRDVQQNVPAAVVVEHPAIAAHPFGLSIGIDDDTTLELSQREWDCMEAEVQFTDRVNGLEIGTELGLSAAVVAKRMQDASPDSILISLPLRDIPTGRLVSAELSRIFGVDGTWERTTYQDGLVDEFFRQSDGILQRKLDYVFLQNSGVNPDTVETWLRKLKPHLAKGCVIFLRTLDRAERLNRYAMEVLGTPFVPVSTCQQPFGYGLAKAVLA